MREDILPDVLSVLADSARPMNNEEIAAALTERRGNGETFRTNDIKGVTTSLTKRGRVERQVGTNAYSPPRYSITALERQMLYSTGEIDSFDARLKESLPVVIAWCRMLGDEPLADLLAFDYDNWRKRLEGLRRV